MREGGDDRGEESGEDAADAANGSEAETQRQVKRFLGVTVHSC